jgi:hypothetical protein
MPQAAFSAPPNRSRARYVFIVVLCAILVLFVFSFFALLHGHSQFLEILRLRGKHQSFSPFSDDELVRTNSLHGRMKGHVLTHPIKWDAIAFAPNKVVMSAAAKRLLKENNGRIEAGIKRARNVSVSGGGDSLRKSLKVLDFSIVLRNQDFFDEAGGPLPFVLSHVSLVPTFIAASRVDRFRTRLLESFAPQQRTAARSCWTFVTNVNEKGDLVVEPRASLSGIAQRRSGVQDLFKNDKAAFVFSRFEMLSSCPLRHELQAVFETEQVRRVICQGVVADARSCQLASFSVFAYESQDLSAASEASDDAVAEHHIVMTVAPRNSSALATKQATPSLDNEFIGSSGNLLLPTKDNQLLVYRGGSKSPMLEKRILPLDGAESAHRVRFILRAAFKYI